MTSLNKVQSRGFEWLLYLIVFTLPLLRPHWNSKLILALVFLWAFLIGPKKIWFQLKTRPIIWFFSSLFFASVIGLIYTANIQFGLKFIETQLPLLVFPVVLISSHPYLNEIVVNRIFYSLILSIISIFCGYAIFLFNAISVDQLSAIQLLQQRLTDFPAIMNQTLINIHPTFLSLYISASVIFLLDQFFKNKKHTAIISILLLTLIAFQIWLSSRAGLISLIIAGIIYVFLRLKSNLRIYTTVIIIFIVVAIFSMPLTKERFIQAPLRALESRTGVNPIDQQTWPFTFRLQITNCSIDLLKNFHWLYGYGTGDFRDEMYRCYERMEYTWLTVRNFDEHNEYFAQLHRLGILGLILLLLVFFYPMTIAYRTKNYLYFSIIIIFSLSCVSENILSSQKGVVFYAVFNTLLFLKCEHNNSRDKSYNIKTLKN